ncbi:MAG: response regulator, partial [Vicinamibacterales bacterium]
NEQRGSYVLVIDDDPITQGIIRRQLTKMGIATRAAFTATEALQMAREHTPLAITLDLLLPDQSGVSVMSSLKADPALAFVPIIVVSIIDDTGAGFALGASEYLVKPVDSLQLAGAMSKLLPSSGTRRVLVVDDDTDARTVMARRASELGGLVTQASNGAEALDAIRHQRPDLILLDLMMPVMDGFGVIDALRADPALRDIAVVVVTARDMSDEDVERLRGTVTALVHKPDSEPTKVADEIGRFVLSQQQKTAAHAIAQELAASRA